MKNQFKIILMCMLFFGIFSCQKTEKLNKPNVALNSPTENSLLYLPDTIEVSFSIVSEQLIESVSVSIVNSSFISLFGTSTLQFPHAGEELKVTMVLRNLQKLNEAPYFILIKVNDGVHIWNSYFNIQLANKSLTFKGFFLFLRSGINQTRIDFYDPLLNNTLFIQCEGEYLESDISSFFNNLFLVTEIPAKLNSFSINENQLDWKAEPPLPNPTFTDIQINEDRVYAGMESGLIVGYSVLNGQQKLVSEVLEDSIPQKICVLEDFIVADYLSMAGAKKTLVTFYKVTGVQKHKQPISFQVVSFLSIAESAKVLIVGNEEGKGSVCLFNVQNNYFEYSNVIHEGEIVAVCEIAEGLILLIIENSIYLHNFQQNITTELMSFNEAPNNLYYEAVTSQVIVQFENRLSFYQYPGMNEITSLFTGKMLKGLQFYYQYD